MEDLHSEERILNNYGYVIKFYYTQKCEFVLGPKLKENDINSAVEGYQWHKIKTEIENLNAFIKTKEGLAINQGCLVSSPNKSVWTFVLISALLLLISFILEFISAYYGEEGSFAIFGLCLGLLGVFIIGLLILKQLCFGELTIEKYMFRKEYIKKVWDAVNEYISASAVFNDNDFAKFEFKPPFLLEVVAYLNRYDM